MTEKEKMLSGNLYNPMDAVLLRERNLARMKFQRINRMPEDLKKERNKLLRELVGAFDKNFLIEPPFFCDYGYNIKLGKNVFMNFNCTILDVMEVNIGDNVLLGPNVQIYTAIHPLDVKTRNSWLEFAKPVTIGNNVWIGGGAIINPGVNIGNDVIVGSGSVVTKDIPNNVVIAGNPAEIIRKAPN